VIFGHDDRDFPGACLFWYPIRMAQGSPFATCLVGMGKNLQGKSQADPVGPKLAGAVSPGAAMAKAQDD
jgi:hypothetical protein